MPNDRLSCLAWLICLAAGVLTWAIIIVLILTLIGVL